MLLHLKKAKVVDRVHLKSLSDRIILAELEAKKIRPPLKWAGGKYQILEQIKKTLPTGNRLIEPFVGSGVVFLNSNYKRYILNDKNKDLILFYKIIKRDGLKFINYCRKLFIPKNNASGKYYALREEFNSTSDEFRKSALFLYINKHGYNGLCRYNSSGDLNVPFGRYKTPYFPEKEMYFFWKKSKRAILSSMDFETVMNKAKYGDVIYCDPPYVPLSNTSNFTSYSAGGFDNDKQTRLALVAQKAAKRGIPVLISNHSTPFTKKIYENAITIELSVRRLISCNGSKREHAKEILALYLPHN